MGLNKKIKQPKVCTKISNIHKKSEIDYPIFCFKYFQQDSLAKCSNEQLKSFFDRLRRLGELGWNEIHKSGRHDYGLEYLPIKKIKATLPAFITPDVEKIAVFRYNNTNNPFIAHRSSIDGNVLHILLIEANFGDVYDH